MQEQLCDGDMDAMCNKKLQFDVVEYHKRHSEKGRVSQASSFASRIFNPAAFHERIYQFCGYYYYICQSTT